MMTDVILSSKKQDWSTPQDFYDRLNDEFHFTLDPCADENNHKCAKWYSKEQNGLEQDWSGERVFCNPPYGRNVRSWVKKSFDEVNSNGCEISVMLLNARTDTVWFHDFVYPHAEIRFVKGRLCFGDQGGRAPFPSMIVIFRKG